MDSERLPVLWVSGAQSVASRADPSAGPGGPGPAHRGTPGSDCTRWTRAGGPPGRSPAATANGCGPTGRPSRSCSGRPSQDPALHFVQTLVTVEMAKVLQAVPVLGQPGWRTLHLGSRSVRGRWRRSWIWPVWWIASLISRPGAALREGRELSSRPSLSLTEGCGAVSRLPPPNGARVHPQTVGQLVPGHAVDRPPGLDSLTDRVAHLEGDEPQECNQGRPVPERGLGVTPFPVPECARCDADLSGDFFLPHPPVDPGFPHVLARRCGVLWIPRRQRFLSPQGDMAERQRRSVHAAITATTTGSARARPRGSGTTGPGSPGRSSTGSTCM
jgi:hypothetical protein